MLLLTALVKGSNHAKCGLLVNQKCLIQPTLNNLHPNQYSQEFHYYPSTVRLARYVGICNTLNDLSNKVCVPNKTEDLNLSVINMITGKNESKTLTKHISCKCKCKLDGKNCDSNQWWNNDICQCECKKHHTCQKEDVWNPSKCNCENGKYLARIIDDSAFMCDEIVDTEAKSNDRETVPTSFNKKKVTCKT